MAKDNHEGYLTTTKPEHPHLQRLGDVFARDTQVLERKEVEYGASWKKRGGIGAFMMLARKWDRLQTQLEKLYHYDIFEAIRNDHREEGVLDDIQDLRRYLALIEAECIEQGWMPAQKLLSDKEWKDLNIASANHAFHPAAEPEQAEDWPHEGIEAPPNMLKGARVQNKVSGATYHVDKNHRFRAVTVEMDQIPWLTCNERKLYSDARCTLPMGHNGSHSWEDTKLPSEAELKREIDPNDRPLREMIKNDGFDNTPCGQCSHPKFQHQMLEGRCTWTHSPMMGCACQHFVTTQDLNPARR
jgi:hypothetical protein